jgi:membrane-associated phospholipid phosphatase
MTRRDGLVLLTAGLAVLAIGMLIVRDGQVPGWEESIFHAVNDLPDAFYPVLWPFQQLGALLIGPIVAVIALILRKYWLALALVVATVLKLVTERAVKALVTRERPGTSIGPPPDIHTRGDVSLTGESFVSGHAVLVAAIAGLLTPYLPPRWKPVPWVVVGLVMITRVYVGAHNPLDVVCGAALGIAIAAAINLVVDLLRRAPASAEQVAAPAP